MQGMKKELGAPQERAKIEGTQEEFEIKKEKKINCWYNIYLATTLCTVLMTVIFLAVGINKHASPDTVWEKLASSILLNEFSSLAGNGQTDNNSNDDNNNIFDILDGIFTPDDKPNDDKNDTNPSDSTTAPSTPQNPPSSLYDFDHSKVPEGENAILPMDLSLTSYGSTYIFNSTGYTPDTKALLTSSFKQNGNFEYISSNNAPLVLIVHTHGTESYSEDGAISFLDNGGEIARSEDTSENVVSVGKVLGDTLNKLGIPTLHCTVMHDRIQYKDSYARAEETIKRYLSEYPSIKLVIDLHRDAVIKSNGDLVRPVTSVNSEATAQVMCVVGSDWGGDSCPSWENNLSLALKLRDALNTKYGNLCRPTYLRSSTYNQELAPYSLLLEVGACGNSVEEARRAVVLVAQELAPLIKKM